MAKRIGGRTIELTANVRVAAAAAVVLAEASRQHHKK